MEISRVRTEKDWDLPVSLWRQEAGRHPIEDAEECVVLVWDLHSRFRDWGQLGAPATRAHLQKALVAEVRRSVFARAVQGETPGERIAHQVEELQRQVALIIDQLLGEVPRRAKPLGKERLAELVQALEGWIHEELGLAPGVSVAVEDEWDPDTVATHRVVIRVTPGLVEDLLAFEDEVIHRLVELTTPSEGPSLRVDVQVGG